MCCGSRGCKESDMTEWLNWTELNIISANESKETKCRLRTKDLYIKIMIHNKQQILKVFKFPQLLHDKHVQTQWFFHTTIWQSIPRGFRIFISSDPNRDFPGNTDGKESACQCRRYRCDPWVRQIPWRRKWQSTPSFLPGKSHRQRNLVGYSPWGRKESDMAERLHFLSLFL